MTFSRSGSVALKSAESSIQKRPPKRDCDCEKNLHGDLGGLLIITGLTYVYGETRLWVWWSTGYADFYVQIVNCWLIRRNSVDFCWIAVLFRGTTAVHAVHVDHSVWWRNTTDFWVVFYVVLGKQTTLWASHWLVRFQDLMSNNVPLNVCKLPELWALMRPTVVPWFVMLIQVNRGWGG